MKKLLVIMLVSGLFMGSVQADHADDFDNSQVEAAFRDKLEDLHGKAGEIASKATELHKHYANLRQTIHHGLKEGEKIKNELREIASR